MVGSLIFVASILHIVKMHYVEFHWQPIILVSTDQDYNENYVFGIVQYQILKLLCMTFFVAKELFFCTQFR